MNITIVVLLLGITLLIIGFFLPKKTQRKYPDQDLRPYVSKNPLTPTETIFYHRLVEALPEFIVLAQVQLSSFLKVDEAQTNYQNYLKWFQPISQQSVDFLICKKDFSIVAAVELDDKSHLGAKAIERDNKKSNNLDAANVTLIRWHAEAMPEADIIKQTILKYALGIDSTMPNQPEWLAGDQVRFFNQRKTNTFSQTIIIWIFIGLIIIWGLSEVKSIFKRVITPQISSSLPSNNQELRMQPINATQEILIRQPQERLAQEAERLRALQMQQEEQQKLTQAREVAKKEDAWSSYYKQKAVECTANEDMVTCGNKYIKNRQQFENDWETHQANLK